MSRLSDDFDESFARLVSREGHTDAIHEALNVIRRHGAAGYLGVFLLHRHFAAAPGHYFSGSATRHASPFIKRRWSPPL